MYYINELIDKYNSNEISESEYAKKEALFSNCLI